ncbi:hypothetical protein BC832DRAFT_591671 [Gaertneriomyces semiglobifer]|nr:hypothetical protein BC832DRAFT_591671 [Gaertneriomyces semiglobifer]
MDDDDEQKRSGAPAYHASTGRILLLFVHGFMGSEQSFETFPTDLLQTLREVHKLQGLEGRVFPSFDTAGDPTHAVQTVVNWLEMNANESEFEAVIALGHSMGGILAVDAWRKMNGFWNEEVERKDTKKQLDAVNAVASQQGAGSRWLPSWSWFGKSAASPNSPATSVPEDAPAKDVSIDGNDNGEAGVKDTAAESSVVSAISPTEALTPSAPPITKPKVNIISLYCLDTPFFGLNSGVYTTASRSRAASILSDYIPPMPPIPPAPAPLTNALSAIPTALSTTVHSTTQAVVQAPHYAADALRYSARAVTYIPEAASGVAGQTLRVGGAVVGGVGTGAYYIGDGLLRGVRGVGGLFVRHSETQTTTTTTTTTTGTTEAGGPTTEVTMKRITTATSTESDVLFSMPSTEDFDAEDTVEALRSQGNRSEQHLPELPDNIEDLPDPTTTSLADLVALSIPDNLGEDSDSMQARFEDADEELLRSIVASGNLLPNQGDSGTASASRPTSPELADEAVAFAAAMAAAYHNSPPPSPSLTATTEPSMSDHPEHSSWGPILQLTLPLTLGLLVSYYSLPYLTYSLYTVGSYTFGNPAVQAAATAYAMRQGKRVAEDIGKYLMFLRPVFEGGGGWRRVEGLVEGPIDGTAVVLKQAGDGPGSVVTPGHGDQFNWRVAFKCWYVELPEARLDDKKVAAKAEADTYHKESQDRLKTRLDAVVGSNSSITSGDSDRSVEAEAQPGEQAPSQAVMTQAEADDAKRQASEVSQARLQSRLASLFWWSSPATAAPVSAEASKVEKDNKVEYDNKVEKDDKESKAADPPKELKLEKEPVPAQPPQKESESTLRPAPPRTFIHIPDTQPSPLRTEILSRFSPLRASHAPDEIHAHMNMFNRPSNPESYWSLVDAIALDIKKSVKEHRTTKS